MAGGGQLGGDSGRQQRGKPNRKKKKRLGFHLDMTPLVDITFLLLTFFMFTTTMLKPQIMEMKVPPEIEEAVDVKASELFTIMLDGDNKVYWYKGMVDIEGGNLPKPIEINKIKELAVRENLKEAVRNKLITVLKVSDDAKYENVVKILDELNLAEIPISEEISKENDEQGQPVSRKRKFTIAKFTEDDVKDLEQTKGL